MAITELPPILPGITVYSIPLRGSGREAEREAVAILADTVIHSPVAHFDDGAPYAALAPELPISVSHGAATAILAVGEPGGPAIGADIESTRRHGQLARVAERFMSPDDDPALSLTELWTAKEAAYKALRQPGLPLSAIAVGRDICRGAGLYMHIGWYSPGPDALVALVALQS